MTFFLDWLGTVLTSLTGLQPAAAVLLIGSVIAAAPLIYSGALDNRLEAIRRNIGYSEIVLAAAALFSMYYAFQQSFWQEFIRTLSGFILGITVIKWYQRLVD